MLSVDKRENKKGPQMSGPVNELSPVDQLPFPGSPMAAPVETAPSGASFSPSPFGTSGNGGVATRSLDNSSQSPNLTRNLPEALSATSGASNRKQVVIRGRGTRSASILPPARPQKRQSGWMLHAGLTMVITGIVLGALLTIVPVAQGSSSTLRSSTSIINQTKAQDTDHQLLMAQRIATPTPTPEPTVAPEQIAQKDGFDPNLSKANASTGGGSGSSSPAQSVNIVDSPGNPAGRFPYGQCTYWAAYRYFQLTGHGVSWSGDAGTWADGAAGAGWRVTSTPHIPSIVVLGPGTQGAGGVGHVAIAESLNSDGSVSSSNMNWGGAGASVTNVNFSPGAGVSFVWLP